MNEPIAEPRYPRYRMSLPTHCFKCETTVRAEFYADIHLPAWLASLPEPVRDTIIAEARARAEKDAG